MKIKSVKKAKVVPSKVITTIMKAKNKCDSKGCLDACTCTGNCE